MGRHDDDIPRRRGWVHFLLAAVVVVRYHPPPHLVHPRNLDSVLALPTLHHPHHPFHQPHPPRARPIPSHRPRDHDLGPRVLRLRLRRRRRRHPRVPLVPAVNRSISICSLTWRTTEGCLVRRGGGRRRAGRSDLGTEVSESRGRRRLVLRVQLSKNKTPTRTLTLVGSSFGPTAMALAMASRTGRPGRC